MAELSVQCQGKKKEEIEAEKQKLEVKVQSVLRLRHRVVECFRTNQEEWDRSWTWLHDIS